MNKVPIRLTEERWFHIVENHDDLAGFYEEILRTVEDPDFILSGYTGANIAVQKIGVRHNLCVIYKEISKRDGFIITAYFTSKINKEDTIWRKKH